MLNLEMTLLNAILHPFITNIDMSRSSCVFGFHSDLQRIRRIGEQDIGFLLGTASLLKDVSYPDSR